MVGSGRRMGINAQDEEQCNRNPSEEHSRTRNEQKSRTK
jgi:hypothetical protein